MSRDPYDQIAPFYDRIHAALTEDIDFILSLAARTGDPILELGCGTGRILLPLAQAGYRVTGIDRSEAMLVRAWQRLAGTPQAVQARVQLVAADMVAPGLQTERYRLVLISYNTFLHVEPSRSVDLCRSAHRSLLPDGRLFLDLVNPMQIEQAQNDQTLTLEGTLTDPEEKQFIAVFASHRMDEAAQILHITWFYDVSPREGGPVQRTAVEMSYHYYYPHQLELLLERSGYALESFYGDYEGNPFSETSERLLVLARRV